MMESKTFLLADEMKWEELGGGVSRQITGFNTQDHDGQSKIHQRINWITPPSLSFANHLRKGYVLTYKPQKNLPILNI